jgi:hypothetical protein
VGGKREKTIFSKCPMYLATGDTTPENPVKKRAIVATGFQKTLRLRGAYRRHRCKCGTPFQASTTGRCWDCDHAAWLADGPVRCGDMDHSYARESGGNKVEIISTFWAAIVATNC